MAEGLDKKHSTRPNGRYLTKSKKDRNYLDDSLQYLRSKTGGKPIGAMSRTGTVRQYGKQTRKPRAERLFAELPQSPVRRTPRKKLAEDGDVGKLSKLVAAVKIDDEEGGEVDVQARARGRASRRSTREAGAECEDERESHEDGKEVAVAQPESPAEAVGKRKLRTKGRKGARVEVRRQDLEVCLSDCRAPGYRLQWPVGAIPPPRRGRLVAGLLLARAQLQQPEQRDENIQGWRQDLVQPCSSLWCRCRRPRWYDRCRRSGQRHSHVRTRTAPGS